MSQESAPDQSRQWSVKVWYWQREAAENRAGEREAVEYYPRVSGPFSCVQTAEEFALRVAGSPRFARAEIVEGRP